MPVSDFCYTIVGFAALSACGGGGGGGGSPPSAPIPTVPDPVTNPTPGTQPSPTPNPTTPPGDPMVSALMVASNWEIGPIIDGKNYSIGMPLRPTQTNDGWAIDFPLQGGSVHYVTFKYGSLGNKSRIIMRYRIEADASVKFLPKCCPELLGIGPTMYFQQKNDDWNREGGRWFATFNAPWPIVSGEFELSIPLNGNWTSVYTWSAQSNSVDFNTAKVNSERIGFTFGGGDGYGHGVYATGQARLVVTSFVVE